MFNFYREFTKDLERRLASRAYDIRPQQVISNDVQMVIDVERPYYRDVTLQMRQTSIPQASVTAPSPFGYIYGQTAVTYTGSVVTPLTAPNPVSTATQNLPLYIASLDNIRQIEIVDVKYDIQLRNTGGAPSDTTHFIQFVIQKHGSIFDTFNSDFNIASSSAVVPAGGLQSIQNRNASNQTIIRLPIIWNNERFPGATPPTTPFFSAAEDQLTWMVRHFFDTTLETQTLLLDIYVALKCRVYIETPYNVNLRTNVVQPV